MPIEGAVIFELHKLCATFSASVNINYRLPITVYYPGADPGFCVGGGGRKSARGLGTV